MPTNQANKMSREEYIAAQITAHLIELNGAAVIPQIAQTVFKMADKCWNEANQTVQLNDLIRSHDFATEINGNVYGTDLEGESACFIEGRVTEISAPSTIGESQITLKVTRAIFSGREVDCTTGRFALPQVTYTHRRGKNRLSYGGIEKLNA